jgi:cell division protein FtsW (lipid II flippase)
MYEVLMASLNNWNATKTERQKLQHCYIVLAFVIVLLAGIISLFNADLGHQVVLFALGSLIAFGANAVVWNLLKSSLIEKLSSKPKK